MKTISIIGTFVALTIVLFWSGCVKEGPMGPPGLDGNANVISSPWYPPTVWNGQTGDWYFDVASQDITKEVVESGVILGYVSIPGGNVPNAVRPMPADVLGCTWSFLIPEYGMIEFLCDSKNIPATQDYYFRYILIPANLYLKSAGGSGNYADELRKMTYQQVCQKFGIKE